MQPLKVLIFLAFTFNFCVAQNKWIWSKTKSNQKVRDYNPLSDKQAYYTEDRFARADRDREPTTKRPLLGQPQNDDIDDYTDVNDERNKQNNPYIPPRTVGHPLIAGYYNGFGNYPQNTGFPSNTPNGILVGPGGPTGVIGRPQAQYPAGLAPLNFLGGKGNYPGFLETQHFPGANVNNNPGFPGYNGINNVLSQYPGQPSYAIPNNPQQFAGAQYPQAQLPGIQYAQQPHYTEGYGLANLNTGLNGNSGFNIQPQFPNYSFGYDEYPSQVEGKSASVKTVDKKVDDKVTKNLKKS